MAQDILSDVLRSDRGRGDARPDSAGIAATLQQASDASYSRRPGSQVMLERISEMMFVHVVGRYLEGLSEQATGWLAGLRDRYTGRALALMDGQPTRDWTRGNALIRASSQSSCAGCSSSQIAFDASRDLR